MSTLRIVKHSDTLKNMQKKEEKKESNFRYTQLDSKLETCGAVYMKQIFQTNVTFLRIPTDWMLDSFGYL